MDTEYRAVVTDVTSFMREWRRCAPGSRYVIVCPTAEHGDVVVWPVMVAFARKIIGCSIEDSRRSLLLPNDTEVRCLGSDKVHLLRGVKVTGALFLDCANHEQMVEMLKLERKFANETLPSPKFGLL